MNKTIQLVAPLALVFSLLLPSSAWAKEPSPGRTVTVTGEAEIKVVPDEVTLTLGVENRSKDLSELKRQADLRLKDVLAAAQAQGIAAKDIKTDYLSLQPEYDYSSTRTFIGYLQRTTVLVTLRDVAKFDALLTAMLKARVEYVHGIDFRTSKLRLHRDEARLLAIKAAKEKATALAGALGQKVGKPYSISEGAGGWWSSYGSWWNRSGYGGQMGVQNVSQQAPSNANAGATAEEALAPGTVSVRATVTVAFDLD